MSRAFPNPSLLLYTTAEDFPPDLRCCCHYPDDLRGMGLFHHPMLVGLLPLALPAAIETVLDMRQAQARSYLDHGDLKAYLLRHERPYRADALLDLLDDGWFEDGREDARAAALFWSAAAYVWTDCEADELDPIWTRIMEAPVPCRAFMSGPQGRRALRSLSDPVRLYRGIQAVDRETAFERTAGGWSWTSERSVAIRFAGRHLAAPDRPFVAETVVARSRIAAYLTNRNESEALLEPSSIPQECITISEVR